MKIRKKNAPSLFANDPKVLYVVADNIYYSFSIKKIFNLFVNKDSAFVTLGMFELSYRYKTMNDNWEKLDTMLKACQLYNHYQKGCTSI